MTVFSYHHTALSVADIDKSCAFYELFGMEKVANYRHDDDSFRIIQLRLGSAILELFWFAENLPLPEHAKDLSQDLKVIGTKHFGFKVDNLEEAISFLGDNGIEVASEPRIGRTGVRYLFFKDPDGILVEVSQDDRVFD
ncbi:VOC family protein [Gymnodinialimonas sp. 2305UL16-5]|uniref:VOC family protein n=1 Tax=Gymnodinialimonas mytili TaxID=3126503 RepID=UPI0030B2AF08